MKIALFLPLIVLAAAVILPAAETPSPEASAMAGAAAGNALPNPGFEEGAKFWTTKDGMSHVVPEAARSGKMGLRVADDDKVNGSSVLSAKLPVKPGQEVTLTFWAKTQSNFCGVYLWFYSAAGKLVQNPDLKASWGHPLCGVRKTDDQWNSYTLKGTAPADAASVAVWIHSFSTATGVADFDDFVLQGIAEGAAPLPMAAEPVAAAPPSLKDLPPRKKPPVIILKLDDFRQVDGKVHGMWVRLADDLKSRHVKTSFGVICQTLAEATPEYVKWINARRAAGEIEFWFHGWDHAVHSENDKQYNEFTGRSYEEQHKRFADSQRLAEEKLGFTFETFGPPGGVMGGSFDAATIRAVADDPHMKAWLYPQPIDAPAKELEAAGKVTILDRVWDVNLEGKVGMPDYNRLVTGYAKHPDREYFVLQGHPMQWGAAGRYAEFIKIIEFLVEQKAVFMTPMEFVALGKKAAR